MKLSGEGLARLFRSNGGVNHGLLGIAVVFFALMAVTPAPRSLVELVSKERPLGYRLQDGTATIAQSVNKILGTDLPPERIAQKAKVMVALLIAAAFLWGTEAIPLGATDLLVGCVLYLFAILPLDSIAKAYMRDAVFFMGGVLTIAVGVGATGLDRRIGILLLGRVKGLKAFCFVFLPLLSVMASFFSEHALMAILVPVLVRMYVLMCEHCKVETDRRLGVMLILGACFALNQGGPGSPSAGGRNAIMVTYLGDFGAPISFAQWVLFAMPYVLVVSLAIGAFIYFTFRRRIKIPQVSFAGLLEQEKKQIGRMSRQEMVMAVILASTVILWIVASRQLGLGGPGVLAVAMMLVLRVITWKDIQTHVRFDVLGLYAAACAMGVGLRLTGGSLWMARTIVGWLPQSMQEGDALLLTISGFTTGMTNFMSDGATVAAIGPVALSMAPLAKLHVWKVALACAFSSSFANLTIVGTPNNAIAYVGSVDPRTGERLLRLRDFLVYGLPVTILAMLLLWLWCILGYWRWIPWPAG